jgi:hypothetical protein
MASRVSGQSSYLRTYYVTSVPLLDRYNRVYDSDVSDVLEVQPTPFFITHTFKQIQQQNYHQKLIQLKPTTTTTTTTTTTGTHKNYFLTPLAQSTSLEHSHEVV